MSISHAIGRAVGKGIVGLISLPAHFLKAVGFYNLPIAARLGIYCVLGVAFGFGSGLGAMSAAAVFFSVMTEYFGYLVNAGESNRNDNIEHLRGNHLVETKVVKKMNAKEDYRFSLGSVPFPKRFECRHTLFAGTTGSGKTRLFHQVLQPTRETDARAIVVDIGGAMVSRYYRGEGSGDIILNPRDARSVAWSPLAEINDLDDVPLVAKALIPDGQGSAAEWNLYAQRLMSGVLQRVWENGGDNSEIIRLLTRAPIEELRELLQGLPAEGMLREGNEKMMASVMAIVANYVTPLSALDQGAGADAFSVSRWVESDTKGEWLFLNFTDRQIEQLKPVICAVVGISISSMLSLKENNERRMFYVLDEFDALGEISGMKSLLTRGRRFGASAIVAIQSVSQLYECYGREVANTLMSNLGTQVILRLPDHDTAEWASKIFGDEQISETMTSESISEQIGSEKSVSTSQQIRQQRVVLASEIQNLPDLVGLLNIVGDIPPCVIQIPPVNPPQVHEEFVKKTG